MSILALLKTEPVRTVLKKFCLGFIQGLLLGSTLAVEHIDKQLKKDSKPRKSRRLKPKTNNAGEKPL